MAKKRKAKSVDRENRSPLMKLKLNQEIKVVESLLSEGELAAFRKLPPSEKRDVILTVSNQQAEEAIDAEIIGYFKQLNAAGDCAQVSAYSD